ncbi:MAG TPA: hypothetical protein VLA58_11785 [Chitinophagaceae bacterium]|nr:hypothetical protein [Chitinophagaceae bacterium]
MKKISHHPFIIRLLNWEYWPFEALYIWTLPALIFFCIRARSFFFFTASNPTIKNGGLIGESKKDIHDILPEDMYPKTVHFPVGSSVEEVLKGVSSKGVSYPMVGKPDIGGRGRGVKILRNEEELVAYVKRATLDFHVQAYVEYPNEVGIFYYRYPNEEKGQLSGIVSKQFLTVTGNGTDTLHTIMRNDKRSIMYLSALEKLNSEKLDTIPAAGEVVMLSQIGNHARGSKFLDRSVWIDEQLTETIDKLSKRIEGFYFGRFDVRYNTLEELKRGEKFMVLELNGAGAEPTHMYDPDHSIFFAVKEIVRHWNILEKISRINHSRGIPYPSFSEGVKIFTQDKEDSRKLDEMTD